MQIQDNPIMRVDIVSDVVCPWCAIGYYQLVQAAEAEGVSLDVHWHPFELNSTMPEDGQGLFEHLSEKYGITKEQSEKNRAQMIALGAELGFRFSFSDEMRMWNTFKAHQLIDWAEQQGRAHETKLALLAAHFSDARNVSDPEVLATIAEEVGLNADHARQALDAQSHAKPVREKQAFWVKNGVQGVPTMIFAAKYASTGAQGVDTYRRILENVLRAPAA